MNKNIKEIQLKILKTGIKRKKKKNADNVWERISLVHLLM